MEREFFCVYKVTFRLGGFKDGTRPSNGELVVFDLYGVGVATVEGIRVGISDHGRLVASENPLVIY